MLMKSNKWCLYVMSLLKHVHCDSYITVWCIRLRNSKCYWKWLSWSWWKSIPVLARPVQGLNFNQFFKPGASWPVCAWFIELLFHTKALVHVHVCVHVLVCMCFCACACVYSMYITKVLPSSAEQYTGFVVILQYWFLISSNFLNTAILQYRNIPFQ